METTTYPSLGEIILRNASVLRTKNGRFKRKQEIRMRNRLKSTFKKQAKWIVENMDQLGIFAPEPQQNLSNSIPLGKNGIGDIDPFLRDLPFQDELVVSLIVVAKASMDKGGKTITTELGLGQFGVSWSLQNPNAIRYLAEKQAFELSNRDGNITSTTKNRIREILVGAAETGQSYQKTAQLIREQTQSGVFSQARAELIATREVAIAYETGNNIPLRDFALENPDRPVLKFWQTVEDDKVTPTHTQNQDDGWIPFEDTFSGTGDEYAPGSDNPRCRCFTQYQIQPPA